MSIIRNKNPVLRLQRLLWRAREAVITMMMIVLVMVMIQYISSFF